jgi:hyperosmotically inducible periplasmic protein
MIEHLPRVHVVARALALAVCVSLLTAGCRDRTAIAQSIDDATISTRVKTALLNEPSIPVTQIDVETSQGIVTLTGAVASKEEERKAVELARQVKGVRDVKSALEIIP